jgi:CheY-like chemotaxis protein
MTTPQRVLLVEDDPDIQLIAQLALESVGGMEVCVCNSGAEAIRLAPEFGPDLILLDVMMPDMDGPETLAALQQLPELAQVPAIFLTARIQHNEVEGYRALGAIDVIAKPFDPMNLPAMVTSSWNHRYG